MRGVFDEAEAAALQVIDLEAQQFGEKEEVVRHRESPEPIKIDPWSARSSRLLRWFRLRPTWSFSSTMAQAEWRPQQKSSLGVDWGGDGGCTGRGERRKGTYSMWRDFVEALESLGEAFDLVF